VPAAALMLEDRRLLVIVPVDLVGIDPESDAREGQQKITNQTKDLQLGLPADPHGQRLAYGWMVIDDQDPGALLGVAWFHGSSSAKHTLPRCRLVRPAEWSARRQ